LRLWKRIVKERVEVELWAALRAHAGGAQSVEIEANNVGEMLDALARAYPGMAELLEDSISVAVNGQIIATSHDVRVRTGDEVVILQRIRGG
jgi:molybdopterin converting factor small subunit